MAKMTYEKRVQTETNKVFSCGNFAFNPNTLDHDSALRSPLSALRSPLVWLVLFLLFTVSCHKDFLSNEPQTIKTNPKHGFVEYDWDVQEQAFFSIAPRAYGFAQERTGASLKYNPLVIAAYNEIAAQNQQHHFVDSIVAKVGLPLWAESFVYLEKSTKDNLVLIPFYRLDKQEVSGFISATRLVNQPGKPFVLNAMGRQELLNVQNGNSRQKKEYAFWMIRYDEILFNKVDTNLVSAFTNYKNQLNGPLAGPPPPQTEGGWKLVNLCWDSETNNAYVGASPANKTPYGDIDGDGIINKLDVDWLHGLDYFGDHDQDGVPNNLDPEWYCWFRDVGDHDLDGIPNDQDDDWLLLEEITDGQIEWGDYWDDYFNDSDENGDGLPDDPFDPEDPDDTIVDWPDDWEKFLDWLEEHFGNDGVPNDGHDGDNGSTDCWYGDPIVGVAADRSGDCCSWFYVYSDAANPYDPNWWNQPMGPNVVPFEDADQYKDWQLGQIIIEHNLDCTSQELGWIVEDCDAFTPGFEDCVLAKYSDKNALTLSHMLSSDNVFYQQWMLTHSSFSSLLTRFKNLIVQLNTGSTASIQDCPMLPWFGLATHIAPPWVVARLDAFNKQFLFQKFDLDYITEADGKLVNLDYYPVKVCLPITIGGNVVSNPEDLLTIISVCPFSL